MNFTHQSNRWRANRIVATASLLAFLSAGFPAHADSSLPQLETQGTARRLIVDGQPFLILGGELGNSTGAPDYLRQFWPKLKALNLNTVVAPVYWDVMEPGDGKFDFATVDGLIRDARLQKMRLVLLWFGTWKNSMSCYAPAWVKTNLSRFPRSQDRSGRPLEILSPFSNIGPNANRSLLGGYSGTPKHNLTVLDGIRARLGDAVNVVHAEGCKITVGGSWQQDEVVASNPADDRRQIAAAVKVAKSADVIVVAIGGNEQTSREAWSLKHMGDRTSLDLVGRQDELVNALLATGKPVVALIFNGRPLSINNLAQNVPAILECWYLGQECGHAVAEVLFGDHNPGGKLPISIPRSVGQLPVFYNHKPSARRGFLWDEATPLFPFGFGLSYTTFKFSNVRPAKKKISRAGATQVSVDVTNTGKRTGTEVVQLYIRDLVSSVTRPVKELKGFEKISLEPGETKTVSFEITPESLAFYDVNMKYVVEPGAFEIMVGSSSRDADLQKTILTVTK